MTARTLTLRPYQQRAVNSAYAEYAGGRRRTALVIPTGGGKTVVGTRPVADCVNAGDAVLWLAHRTELIEQAEEALRGNTSGLGVGVMQATRREYDRPTIVGSIQTVARPGALGLVKRRRPRLIVVDECHHVAARSYQHILSELGAFDPGGPLVLGLTATLGRSDGLALGDTFESVAETIPISELIATGDLLPPLGIRVRVDGLDLSRVRASRTSDSGLDDRAVTRAMSDSLAPAAAARAVLEHCKGRHGVAFWPSVELSREAARIFADHGLRSVHVDADTPKAVRKVIMQRARAGEYDVVHNVGLFTEGTDVPIWSYVVLGRLTSSEVLFTQMAGRALRPYPGQRDAIVLDLVGVTGRHALRSVVQLDGVKMIDELDDELKQFDEPEDENDEPKTVATSTPDELPQGVDGELVHELVDLFGASHVAWQRSPRGVWFLPTGGGRAVVLAPNDPGLYDVRWDSGELVHEDPSDLAAAMSWGEQAAKSAAVRPLERAARERTRKLSRWELMDAIYAGVPGGAAAPATAGALTDVQDARWAATALDDLSWLAGVSPGGYWHA